MVVVLTQTKGITCNILLHVIQSTDCLTSQQQY